jgi:hypothetical protein
VAAAEVAAIAVDLDDRGLVRVELAPGEVGAEQQQRVALHQRVEAGFDAEDAGHAHVVRVVRLDEILGARGVRDRRLQAPGQFQQLRVRALATGTGIDADALALPQQFGDALQLGIGRAQHRLGVVHRERHIVLHLGLADVGRQDHHRHATAADRGLAGQGDHAPRLLGLCTCSQNTEQLAYTALKSTSCGNSMPSSLVTTWLAISTIGARLRLLSNTPLMKCRLPGPQEPAQAVSSPLTSESAPAAKAATSSWRTCTQRSRCHASHRSHG